MKYVELKYYLIPALIFSVQLFFCKAVFAQGNFKLAGTIDRKYEGGYVKLMGSGIRYSSIKADIKNGQFYFADKIEKEYEAVVIEVWKNERVGSVRFFILPGKMRIIIRNIDNNPKKNDIYFINIPFVDVQNEYENLIKKSDDKYSVAAYFIDSIRKLNDGNIPDSLWNKFLDVRRRKIDDKIEFIKKHANSYYSLHVFWYDILNECYIDSDSLRAIYSLFSSKLKNTIEGKFADTLIKRKSAIHLYKILPEITFKTDSGKVYTISEFRDKKYVLVCFWASWCGPCKKNIPFLREIANSYQPKGLQLISISIDEEKERWKLALDKYPMSWPQTCDVPEYMSDQKIREQFSISIIPQYFLIDMKGKIIYNNFQSKDDDNYSELQHILKLQLN